MNLLRTLVFHFRPASVAEPTLKFTHTWGLGGMATVLVLLQMATGTLLKFVYQPFPSRAYSSMVTLRDEVAFGQLVRNIHHWDAHLLVLLIFLHLLRVFFTAAYLPPRQWNWVVGLGLLGCVLAANFTGYLLPYDQLAYWAVTVSTAMLSYLPGVGAPLQALLRGGSDVGPASLSLFFTLHTTVIPAMLMALMAFHFWRIRKAGGLVIPRAAGAAPAKKVARVPVSPNLLLRETTVALVLMAAVLMLSVFFNAPLGDAANPGLSPNPTKAPWYFAGLQELLLHVHPTFAVLVIPVVTAAGLVFLPFLRYEDDTRGIWLASHKGRRMAAVSAVVALTLTPAMIVIGEIVPDSGLGSGSMDPLISGGLIPFVLMAAALIGFYTLMRRWFSAANNEAVLAVFVLLTGVFFVLTVTGVWFRGPGMKLGLP